MTKQEKDFLDVTVKRYFGPVPYMINRTLTITDAAILVAKDMGYPVPADPSEAEAYMEIFMGGLFGKTEATDYIEAQVQAHMAQRETDVQRKQYDIRELKNSMKAPMQAIVDAALELRSLSADYERISRPDSYGLVFFDQNSAEWDALKAIAEKLDMTI